MVGVWLAQEGLQRLERGHVLLLGAEDLTGVQVLTQSDLLLFVPVVVRHAQVAIPTVATDPVVVVASRRLGRRPLMLANQAPRRLPLEHNWQVLLLKSDDLGPVKGADAFGGVSLNAYVSLAGMVGVQHGVMMNGLVCPYSPYSSSSYSSPAWTLLLFCLVGRG